jgi:hypothetical protein
VESDRSYSLVCAVLVLEANDFGGVDRVHGLGGGAVLAIALAGDDGGVGDDRRRHWGV